jgi:hypothetical protein
MNSKFISFALSIFILSIALSAVAHPTINKYKDSSELFKRTHEEHDNCSCTAATSEFTDKVWGNVVFGQNECGETLCAGIFSDGLVDPEKNCYDYLIMDTCGNLLYNLTDDISPKYRKNGTWPWSTRIKDLNLDCHEDGVLLAYCEDEEHNKTHYHKRDTGAVLQIQQNGQNFASAPLNQI